ETATMHDERAERARELAQSLFQSVKIAKALGALTNTEIANLLRDHVWANMVIFSPQADLVKEAIERLKICGDGDHD
ncbi:MAG: hypothetical protein ABID84_03625, partial [Chloroflexota bacterium]